MSGGEDASLEATPSWAVAAVCSALILIALLIEHALHLLTMFVRRRKRKALNQAVYQIKSELRNLGFMSLLLTIAKQPLTKICIPRSWAGSFLPCNNSLVSNSFLIEEIDTCKNEGKVPLVPAEGIQQLQMLILLLAIFHVISCVLTLILGEAKMRRWGSWEEETRSLEYQLSHDSRRFMLTKQTSFGRRHLKRWSKHDFRLWLVCFVRQFIDSVPKADYFALRHGFIKVHLSKGKKFDFHKFVQRTLDQDFVTVVRISPWIWVYAILFIVFNAQGFYNHYWLPFIPLVTLLVVGAKLETIINKMCSSGSQEVLVTPGIICIKPDNEFFWFKKPELVLHLIQFILIQNSFQLAFFTWSWYKFGLRSCFHKKTEDIVLSAGMSLLVQFLCAYVTLPLYALVTQMGSSMKETIFTERVVDGLKNWHHTAKENLTAKENISTKLSTYSSSQIQPQPSPKAQSFSSSFRGLMNWGNSRKENLSTRSLTRLGSLMQQLPSPRAASSYSNWMKPLPSRVGSSSSSSRMPPIQSPGVGASSSSRMPPIRSPRVGASSSSWMPPTRSPRVGSSSFSSRVLNDPQFVYPTGRNELMEMQKVVEEIIECSSPSSSIPQREPSFRMWWRQELISPKGDGNDRVFP